VTDEMSSTTDLVEEALRADAVRQGTEPGANPARGVLTHWFAISAWTQADAGGQLGTLRVHFRDDVMPLWQLRGLLHEALRICVGDDEENDT